MNTADNPTQLPTPPPKNAPHVGQDSLPGLSPDLSPWSVSASLTGCCLGGVTIAAPQVDQLQVSSPVMNIKAVNKNTQTWLIVIGKNQQNDKHKETTETLKYFKTIRYYFFPLNSSRHPCSLKNNAAHWQIFLIAGSSHNIFTYPFTHHIVQLFIRLFLRLTIKCLF